MFRSCQKCLLSWATILLCIIMISSEIKATHMIGCGARYNCVGPGQYLLALDLTRDCNGIRLPPTWTMNYTSSCGSGSIILNRTLIQDITPTCGNQSACSGGNGSIGVEQHFYSAVLTLPPGCTNVIFSARSCCRNSNVVSLVGNPAMYLEVAVNNTVIPCNNSPVFLNPPLTYICINQPVIYNVQANDFDGDSLSYALVDCEEAANDPVTYQAGYSGTAPLGASVPVTINPQTGEIRFTPNMLTVAPVCVEVTEYRNGVFVGSSIRDMNVHVINCTSNNANPSLSGIDGTSSYQTTTCYGRQLCFDVIGSDTLGPNDVLTMTSSSGIFNSTFTSSGAGVPSGNQVTGTFCWTPTIYDIGTHNLFVTIEDNACPLKGTSTYTYTIHVVGNTNDPVDAGLNADVCLGDSVGLSATTTATNVVSYEWIPNIGLSDPNVPNPQASPPSTTTYTVRATYSDGCVSTDQVTVTVNDPPKIYLPTNPLLVCGGSTVVISVGTDALGMNFSFSKLYGSFNVIPSTVTGANATAVITIPTNAGSYPILCEITNPVTGCSDSEILLVEVASTVNLTSCNLIYASTTGSPTAMGTPLDPVTLEEAVRRANCNNTIVKMATGTYQIDAPLAIKSNLTLEGGFIEQQDWIKTSEIGATTIHRTRNNPRGVLNFDRNITALEVLGSTNFRLQDFSITTDDAIVEGTSTYGIYMNNASDYHITRINVEPGNASNGSNGAVGCTGTDGTAGTVGQNGQPNGQSDNVQGGNGGFGGNSCGSFAVLFGGGGGRNADFGNGIGNGGNGNSASAGVVDGGAGGGGGRGGNAVDGADGGFSGRGGTPLSPPAGCSATGAGLGTAVAGGLGGGRNTLGDAVGFNNGSPAAGQDGTNGVDGTDGCNGIDGAAGSFATCRYTVGSQGTTGMSGSGGSGGGGGGGGGGQGGVCGCINGTGAAGGGGGGGGAAGIGGEGGFGGGASFGIYMCANGANGFIEHCHVSAGALGAGGQGGAGGIGGQGGVGGQGGAGTAIEVQDGGDGGNGGNGGNGGVGGNGQDGIAIDIYWDGNGIVPVSQDSTYALYNQQIIYASNVNCTNTDVLFWDSSQVASHPLTTAIPQLLPIGNPNTSVTNWTFDAIGLNTIPTLGTFNADTARYNSVGRYNILHNTCTGCPASGGTAGNTLSEYRGFHNIAFDQNTQPEILSSATQVGIDIFQLCVGDFASFSSSISGDSILWEFDGAIPNPGNVQNLPSTQFNTAGFFTIELSLWTSCCGQTPIDTIYLYVTPIPTPSVSGDSVLCLGDSTYLTVGGLDSNDLVIWTTNNSLTRISNDSALVYPTIATTYTATVYSIIYAGFNPTVGCSTSVSYTVGVNAVPRPSLSSTDAICNANGTATASYNTGLYDFVWANGTVETNVMTSTINNLSAGNHCVTVTDPSTGCMDTFCVYVNNDPSSAYIYTTTSSTSCFGTNDGCVTIGTANGVAPYTYVWDTIVPGIPTSTSVDYTVCNLPAGVYSVTSTDVTGCASTTSFEIISPAPLEILVIDTVSALCGNNGRIEVEVIGGTGLHSYVWSTGDTTLILDSLGAGQYCMTATDANNCATSICLTLTQQQALLATAVLSSPISCHGDSACVTIQATGGSGNYLYSINGGLNQTDSLFCGLVADTTAYIITILDTTNNCTTTTNITIGEPSPVVASISNVTMINCFGDSTGSIAVSATGGVVASGYTYVWNTGATTSVINNLVANVAYCVTVSDDNACTSVVCQTLSQPSVALSVSLSEQSSISCHGGNDGVIEAIGVGGTGSLTYLWGSNTGSQTTSVVTGLSAGTYCVTVTDSLGCTLVDCITISEPSPVVVGIVSSVNVDCNGNCTGSATVLATGGTPNYSYQWNNAQNTASISNLCAGTYIVTITDANGCIGIDSVIITEPATALTGTIVDNGDGTATAIGTGGTGAYTYQWDVAAGNQTTATATGLVHNGVYSVTITDANACSVVVNVTVNIVGLQQISNLESFDVLPNPNNGTFQVRATFSKEQKATIRLTNVLGQVLQTHTYSEMELNIPMELKDQASGVYFVTLQVGNQYRSQKIIVTE